MRRVNITVDAFITLSNGGVVKTQECVIGGRQAAMHPSMHNAYIVDDMRHILDYSGAPAVRMTDEGTETIMVCVP